VGWVYNGVIAGVQAFKARFLVPFRTVIPRREKHGENGAGFPPG